MATSGDGRLTIEEEKMDPNDQALVKVLVAGMVAAGMAVKHGGELSLDDGLQALKIANAICDHALDQPPQVPKRPPVKPPVK